MNALDYERIKSELDARFAMIAGTNHDLEKLYADAATAIRHLSFELCDCRRDLKDCRNELCLKCGDYKLAHKGACDGCRWKDLGD